MYAFREQNMKQTSSILFLIPSCVTLGLIGICIGSFHIFVSCWLVSFSRSKNAINNIQQNLVGSVWLILIYFRLKLITWLYFRFGFELFIHVG